MNDISVSSSFFERFKLISRLGEGSFGKIYKGIDNTTNKLVAIKVETKKETSHNQLKTEMIIYKDLQGSFVNNSINIKWPQIYKYDDPLDSVGSQILVMDLLGPNLNCILKKGINGKLSIGTVAYFAEKMITLVEKFHLAGYVHRDLKPHNFVLEYCENVYPKYPEIFLIDYGLAKKYVQDGRHIPFTQKKAMKGTIVYSSVHTHLGIDQSRRDDLESLGYIFVYLILGILPWHNIMKEKTLGCDKKLVYAKIMIAKMKTPTEKMLKGIPEPIKSSILAYFLYVNSLMYHQEPNYNYIRSLFKEITKKYFMGNIY